ncbi:MAG: 2TM domain-containing protein [Defluviitaleaceae bacterium]|nr:2TM domain-containing protein [Defluviitaleaceae bacterium]MCL2240171.1 2TM domain-containing protein [Defluviitaleaceae bacterium]
MEGRVALYDSSENKIGVTYVRRARQLVKQQRASWVDESQSAIRFAPGMENLDEPTASGASADDELLKLAKRRVYARFAYKLHCSIVLVLSCFLTVIYILTDPGGYFWPMWPMLAFGLSIVIHRVVYKVVSGHDMENKIAQEYELLKHRFK